jgi:dihydrofolate synthase/folylpolyglutamate synthase
MSTGNREDFESVAAYLYGLKPRGNRLGIDRMRPLAEALGHPENSVPTIHIAGTNGKGSVCAMLEAILRKAGWRVGLYTSPHLVHLGERVQVDRVCLAQEEIVAYTQRLDAIADRIARERGDEMRPSFFEFMTAMAFLHFAQTRCDVAVVEVGLGGEFDATNIVTPELSVITSIGLDHCEWLGNSLENIARAKAGIIKQARPIVMGRVPTMAESVIRQIAAQCSAPLFSVRETFGETIERYPQSALAGVYQRWNAATATLAARTLDARWGINDRAIEEGLAHAHWPGRWEMREIDGRTVVLDASHNPEGAETLDANLAQIRRDRGRLPIVVLGVLGLDRAAPLLDVVSRHAAALHLVEPRDPRAVSAKQLQSLIPKQFSGPVIRDDIQQIFPGGKRCGVGSEGDVVVVTGSIYLLGEVIAQLER